MNEYSFFFFSSRRRHTRYWRDWSSDVCSSDLRDPLEGQDEQVEDRREQHGERAGHDDVGLEEDAAGARLLRVDLLAEPRSEERRVGKECRSRWSPYH